MGTRYGIEGAGLEVIKLNHAHLELSMKFIMIIDVKIPTLASILTFISIKNTTSEILKTRNDQKSIFQHTYTVKILCSAELNMKNVL